MKSVSKDFRPSNTDCSHIPQVGSAPLEALQYFSNYFPYNIFNNLARFTNIYSLQRDGVELNVTPDEIKVFVGILLRMAVLKFPLVPMYWQEDKGLLVLLMPCPARDFSSSEQHCM